MSFLIRGTLLSLVLLVAGPANADAVRDLVVAAQMDDPSTVKKLLAKGISPNTVDPISGEPVILLALREGSDRAIDALLADKGFELERTAPNGNTALMMAAFKRNKRAVLALLDKGAAVNRAGWTPLHYAAASGDEEIAAILLEKRAKIDAGSPSQLTPLMIAAREGKPAVAEFLLQKGANTRLKNNENLTASEIALRADHPLIAAAIERYVKTSKQEK